jgi:hypothetical protein
VVAVFPILGEPSAAIEPSDGPLHEPTFGLNNKALGPCRGLYDLNRQTGHRFGGAVMEDRARIGAISKQLAQERELAEQRGQQHDAAVAILNIGASHQRVQHQAQGVNQHVTLLALDQLAAIVARRIDAGPPFSALFMLWLSITQAVGLASRSACSRHLT